MKKAVSLFLLFLAQLVLLVHAVIPHHHHDDITCFGTHHEADQTDCCRHSGIDQHSTGDKDENDICSLNDLLAIIPNGLKQQQIHGLQVEEHHSAIQLDLQIVAIPKFSIVFPDPVAYTLQHFKPHHLKQPYTCSVSLRAPPLS